MNTRLFRRFCEQMDADHCNLLYHTEVRWLSEGNVVKRVFSLWIELIDFFVQQKKEGLVRFLHEDVTSLAYLDIFGKLNELNLSLQGQDKIIIDFIDTLSAFQTNLELWERKMSIGKMGRFPTLNELIEDTENMRLNYDVKSNIINNLIFLHTEFTKYFPDTTTRDDLRFVRNLYLVSDSDVINMFNGNDSTQEKFITLKNDSTSEDVFKVKTLPAFGQIC